VRHLAQSGRSIGECITSVSERGMLLTSWLKLGSELCFVCPVADTNFREFYFSKRGTIFEFEIAPTVHVPSIPMPAFSPAEPGSAATIENRLRYRPGT
jgi:hypothetical protein